MNNVTGKYLLIVLLSALVTVHVQAQTVVGTNNGEIMKFTFRPASDTLYFQTNEGEFKRLYEFVDRHLTAITSGDIPVHVDGYCASASNQTENRRIAFTRSNRVKSELIVNKGLQEKHFITQNHTTAFNNIKDVVIVTFRLPEPPAVVEVEPRPVVEEKPVVVEEKKTVNTTPVPHSIVEEPVSTQPDRRILDLRTNLLYDAFLTPTLGIEWHINNNIGIKLDGSFAFWGNEHGRVHKVWVISPEVRWYMGDSRRFYLGAGANTGKYNIYRGMVGRLVSNNTGYQGKMYGGGITVGYMLKMGNAFSLDFNLGLGYTRFEYDTFGISNEVRVYKGKNLTKNVWGPTQAGVTLVWHFIR